MKIETSAGRSIDRFHRAPRRGCANRGVWHEQTLLARGRLAVATGWLGDRKAIEERTTTWDKTVVDRTAELKSWIDYCHQIRKRGVLIYAYANNHFGGHASATVEQFRSLWHAKGLPEIAKPPRARLETSLFPM